MPGLNNLLVNPIIINSAMNAGYKSSTLAALGSFQYLLVEKLYWRAPVTPGDQCIIEDLISGNVLAQMTCEAANNAIMIDWTAKPKRWSDFQVTTLNSGELYIYLA